MRLAALASHPPQPGDQIRITVEPIDDPEPDVPYPLHPLSGRFRFSAPERAGSGAGRALS